MHPSTDLKPPKAIGAISNTALTQTLDAYCSFFCEAAWYNRRAKYYPLFR